MFFFSMSFLVLFLRVNALQSHHPEIGLLLIVRKGAMRGIVPSWLPGYSMPIYTPQTAQAVVQ
jgi:hypothetical protein